MSKEFHPGMGQAVAERTILRKKKVGDVETWETWDDVAHRVALGNSLLCGDQEEQKLEYDALYKHISRANTLMSGRHLQHGDETQPSRNMEVFTNCFYAGTHVPTLEYGPVPIGNLVGKSVTLRATDGVWRMAEVHSFGRQQLYCLKFALPNQAGIEHMVLATRNHRWFLRDGSITDRIEVGDYLRPAPVHSDMDEEGIRHGLIFGDGSNHKRRVDLEDGMCSQGREYCAIRLCGADKKYLNLFASYPVSYPDHAGGDPVVYVGKKRFWKDVPFTSDPSYIAGFIHGWWMADGSKTFTTANGSGIEISSANEMAVEWLQTHAAYAGFSITGHRIRERVDGDGSYQNGQRLHTLRLRQEVSWKLISIEEHEVEEVFCAVEPVTSGFVLANGLLTGNCSTSSSSFMQFYLLMNGSGVGRCYDDDMMLVDWDNAPTVRCVLDETHADFDWSAHESVRDAKHKYGTGRDVMWYEVPDTREGWAKALEILEVAAFEKIHKDKLLILDFSKVRAKGSPIKGMQNRPASGPVPLMNAFNKAMTLRGAGLDQWKQTIYIDHYFAECVLVGGARRAARMSTKSWKDRSVLDFITVKRPIEYYNKNLNEILQFRNESVYKPSGFLWSSNNSITVDEEFWRLLSLQFNSSDPAALAEYQSDDAIHARAVYNLATAAAFGDGTGEPGFINVHKLNQSSKNMDVLGKGEFVHSAKYQVNEDTQLYLDRLMKRAKKKQHFMIVNPCGEIPLALWGGFCVIADVVPFHSETLDEAEESFRVTTRALMRVNLMDSVYKREVTRTNRIGVGMTGLHEFAWKYFKFGFYDLINEEKSKDFWMTLSRFKRAVQDEAKKYAKKLGVRVPHTDTTMKPAGTTSKLFGLTEAAHLPAMVFYLRWVQFNVDDPLVESYKKAGYPVRHLKTYKNTAIVGFPTSPVISTLGLGDKLVTAGQASAEDQYKWLKLLEKYWLRGVDEAGVPLEQDTGNQISYTLKYDPRAVSYEEFCTTIYENQSQVKCCSVMPQEDNSSYEYLPEESVTKAEYEAFSSRIKRSLEEDIAFEHVDCANGACPVDFRHAVEENRGAA